MGWEGKGRGGEGCCSAGVSLSRCCVPLVSPLILIFILIIFIQVATALGGAAWSFSALSGCRMRAAGAAAVRHDCIPATAAAGPHCAVLAVLVALH